MIKISNIKKSFNQNQILNGLSFQINKGDVLTIIGPSGAGKTTLLRCIDFLERADEGTLIFDNESFDFTAVTKKQIYSIRRRIGFVFQSYYLFNNKTALGNVMEGLTARKIPKAEAEKLAKQALDKVGLSDRYDYYPSQLSGGQQQRVGIARALAPKPDLILFDEPTSALDPELIGEVLSVMKLLAGEGVTMVVVTHELSFARDVANRVIFIEKGLIIEDSSSKEFFDNPSDNPRHERIRLFLSRTERTGKS